ncbi:MAG: hypothetical protein CL824_04970 [Crocinitomicaceae bacterium]|nr:hypothetical protein [Crocinitomicaceae bacterium]
MTPFKIQDPCSKKWDSMKIEVDSRFCKHCEKNVIDFTQKTRTEILEYLLTNNNKKICGRVYSSQIDFSKNDLIVHINLLEKKHKNRNLSFFLLAASTLFLLSCENNEIEQPLKEEIKIEETKQQTDSKVKTDTSKTPDKDEKKSRIKVIDQTIVPTPPILGDIDIIDTCKVDIYCDTMPEFKGGIDSLSVFIKNNLEYPKWASKKNIQGRVFVSFIVDENGDIKNAKILRNEADPRLDKYVLKVIYKMPKWTPGILNGNYIAIKMTLPVNFQLDK